MFNKLNFKDRMTVRFLVSSLMIVLILVVVATGIYMSDVANEALRNLMVLVGILAVIIVIIDFYISKWVTDGIQKPLLAASTYTRKASETIDRAGQTHEGSVKKLVGLIKETNDLVKKLSVTSDETKQSAQKVADKSNQALEMSEQGQQSMYVNIKNMTTLKQKIETIAEQILELSEHTQQIGSIVGVVEDITEQTNMLALNAVVEAARAGEHGRGFAVVASEIRKLADQIKQATTKITSLIYDIQQATNSTVMATEEGTKEIEAGVNLANQASETINALRSTMHETVEAIEAIVSISKDQFKCASDVSEVMSTVSHGIEDSVHAVEKSKNAIIVLEQVAGSLNEIIISESNHKKHSI
jgi:methyl-accepting chemotaxis protein